MFKFFFKLLLMIMMAITCLVIYGLFSYRFVRTDEGFHLIRKESPSFRLDMIDTRDWNALDYLRNAELTEKLSTIHWDSWQETVNEQWSQLAATLDEFREDLSLSNENIGIRKELEQLEKSLRSRYHDLKEKLLSGDLDIERFHQEIAHLKIEAEKNFKKLREKLPASPM